MPSDLEKDFHRAMLDLYRDAKADADYNATRFLSMVSEMGGVETAKVLLRAKTVSEGYTALWERQRLDLTVEAVVLEEKWWPLFTDEDRQTAVTRLRQYDYSGVLPDVSKGIRTPITKAN